MKFSVQMFTCFVSSYYMRLFNRLPDGFISRRRLLAHSVQDIGYASLTYTYSVKVLEGTYKAIEGYVLNCTQIGDYCMKINTIAYSCFYIVRK